MKKIFYLTALAVMVLASCGKENGTDNIPQEGAKATLSIKMAFPSRTYANEDATTAESTVNTVDVFIFDANGGSLVTHRHMALSDFTPAGTTYTNTGIVTTSGQRKVGVGINLPAAIVTEITTQRSIDAINDQKVYDVTTAMIATDNNFVMFSTEMPVVTVQKDGDSRNPGDNEVSLNIERMAGKAALAKVNGFDFDANSPISSLVDLKALDYRLMQTNKKSYLMREPYGKDPNYLSADFGSLYNANVFENTADADYKPVDAALSDNSTRPAFYGAENTSDFYQKGTTTYFLVRAQFTPKDITDGTGASTGAGTPEADFWIVTNGELANTYFCNDENDATTLAGTHGAGYTVTKHEKGYCYWSVWIGNKNDHEFLRNNYYLGQIEAFNGFGEDSEGNVIDPPTGPVDEERATLECNFTILDWTFNAAEPVVLP